MNSILRSLPLVALVIVLAASVIHWTPLPAAEPVRAPRKVALLVGTNKYDHDFSELKYAERDVTEVAKVLQSAGYEVVTLTGSAAGKDRATKKNVEARLKGLLDGGGDDDKKIRQGDVVLVYLSGHGLQKAIEDPENKASKKDQPFYCPVDGKSNDAASLVSIGYLLDDLLGPCGSSNLLLIDACREIADANKKGLEGRDMSLKGKTGVLFSCGRGELSWENKDLQHSVFTHAVLAALNGKAAKKGVVTWSALVSEVQDEMASAEFQKQYIPNGYTQTPIPSNGQLPRTEVLAKAFETAAAELKAGEERSFEIADGVKMVFCWIPPGEAQLGSPKAEREAVMKQSGVKEEPEWLKAEAEGMRGKHVEKKGFWLGKYPVTQAEWTSVMGEKEEWFYFRKDVKGLDTSRLPADQVVWVYAQDFLGKLNQRAGVAKVFGKGGRLVLPHEDRWEYAYRGGKGNKSAYYWGDALNGDQANCVGNYPFGTTDKGDYKGRPTEVGSYESKAPHPWGLCDMSGNVFQWCDNKYSNGVLRGGSWVANAIACRAASRFNHEPGNLIMGDFGFRVCVILD